MLIAAAHAIAGVVTDEELNPNYIVPSVFHPDVHNAVATAVQKAVAAAGVSAGSAPSEAG
jgi:malate dehydrogenase (oxaloacetate-decarboxylating)